jgi:hypothetical protein
LFSRQLHTIKNRIVGLDHAPFSVRPLWNLSVAEAPVTFPFAAEIRPIAESPSEPTRSAVPSASYDVLQWLQMPNFDV